MTGLTSDLRVTDRGVTRAHNLARIRHALRKLAILSLRRKERASGLR